MRTPTVPIISEEGDEDSVEQQYLQQFNDDDDDVDLEGDDSLTISTSTVSQQEPASADEPVPIHTNIVAEHAHRGERHSHDIQANGIGDEVVADEVEEADGVDEREEPSLGDESVYTVEGNDEGIPYIAVALYAYEAQDEEELSFQPGDRFYIIDKSSDWWCCKRVDGNGNEGFCPSNFLEV